MIDQFYDPRTYKKVTVTNRTNNSVKKANKPDSFTRKINDIDNNTECFTIERTGMDIANRIKTLRAQKEMTQKEVAQRMSVKVDIIRDYENGKAIPDSRIINRLEQILGGTIREKQVKKKK